MTDRAYSVGQHAHTGGNDVVGIRDFRQWITFFLNDAAGPAFDAGVGYGNAVVVTLDGD